jgi:5'-methylthioadenosine nucleosidase
MITSILIVVAMMQEAEYFVKQLGLEKKGSLKQGFPTVLYEGELNNKKIHLVVNGVARNTKGPDSTVDNVGSQAAVLSTTLGILQFQPDLIISSGVAGGVKSKDAHLKDIFVSTENKFMDRRMPGTYVNYGIGNYASYALPPDLNDLVSIKKGIVCSSDSFNDSPTDIKESEALDCSVEEMEAAGVAWVSSVHDTPMFSLKGIVDITGSKNSFHEFNENFIPVMEKLSKTLKTVIEEL